MTTKRRMNWPSLETVEPQIGNGPEPSTLVENICITKAPIRSLKSLPAPADVAMPRAQLVMMVPRTRGLSNAGTRSTAGAKAIN